MRDKVNIRIDPLDRTRSTFSLWRVNLIRPMQHLALQVGQRDDVVIDHTQCAHASRRQIQDRRRAQPASADHQHPGLFQTLLPWPADFVQHDVASVTIQFFGRESHGTPLILPIR